LFAQFIPRRDEHGDNERDVDLDLKLFFALTNAVFDAGICAWYNNAAFASVRPITRSGTCTEASQFEPGRVRATAPG
jgi:hypothetical protein